ncbi:MAG TPA: hypothetical protein GXX46_08820 [Peptococcaceae bacterium]|nr:hypothetical protein [Peptococcaceae bacterium]
MRSITIFREITIKQIITEKAKEVTRRQLEDELLAIYNKQRELEEKKNKMITEFALKGADEFQLEQIRKKFDSEASDYHRRQDEIRTCLAEIDDLKIGEEAVIGSIEGPYELKVGDNLDSAVKAEIILKDGVVMEIRQ